VKQTLTWEECHLRGFDGTPFHNFKGALKCQNFCLTVDKNINYWLDLGIKDYLNKTKFFNPCLKAKRDFFT